MSLLDGIAGFFILYFAWKGFQNGLVKEVFRIVGLVLAVFIAFQYADVVASWIKLLLDAPAEYLPYFAFALLFILAIITVQVGIIYFDNLIQLLLLSTPNRLFGSLFGIIKSSLFVSITLIFLAGFGFPNNEVKQKSLMYKPLLKVAPASYDIVARVLPGVKPYKDSVEYYLSIPDVTD